jgi:hypothetical protein
MTGRELVVQIKASEKPSGNDDFEVINGFRISTYNYLMGLLSVVMLVKYIASEREAYWALLHDIPAPTDESQVTMGVKVPRANRISKTDWQEIAAFIGEVTDCKLKVRKDSPPSKSR